jgi:hypothetical protein
MSLPSSQGRCPFLLAGTSLNSAKSLSKAASKQRQKRATPQKIG